MNNESKRYEYPGPEKTGLFIKKLRLAHNLTQENLGDMIFVTRKAVSKWENGICYPSIELIPILADIFGVTLEEILNGEFRTSDNFDGENKSINFMLKLLRKRSIKMIAVFIGVVMILCLVIFFFENYNATKIYSIGYRDDNFNFRNGIIVTTRANTYFNFGIFSSDLDDIGTNAVINFKLYTIKNHEKVILMEYQSSDLIYIGNGYDKITTIDMNKHIKKLYLNISYIDKNGEEKDYDIKLRSKLEFRSNDIFNTKVEEKKDAFNTSELKLSESETPINDIENNVIDLKFLYDLTNEEKIKKYNYTYLYNDKKYTIKCEIDDIVVATTTNLITINFQSNVITYMINNYKNRLVYPISNYQVNIHDNDIYTEIYNAVEILK